MSAAQVGVVGVLVALGAPALAAPPTRLAYEAPQGCPSEREFVAAVTARGADFDVAQATAGRRVMVVSIHRRAEGFAGAFQVREDRDATNRREVRGASCAEVADALAVVTAIALHAEADAGGGGATSGNSARAGGDQSAAPPPTAATAAPSAGAPPPVPPLPAAPSGDRLRGETRGYTPRTETVAVHAGTLRFDLQRSVSLYAGASAGLIRSVVLPRYDVTLLGASFVTTPEGQQRIAGLVAKLHIGVLGPGTYQSPDTKTDISGLTFGIDLCQSRYDSKGLVLLFCGGYGGGEMKLTTKGRDGAAIQSKNTGFGEATLSTEVQYYLGAGLHIGARVGGGFTVGQITAERADGSHIFTSSPWTAQATLGLGLRF